MYAHYPEKRYRNTLEFLKKHVDTDERILDLGVPNPFSEIMTQEGYTVQNTGGEDLDLELDQIRNSNATVVTAFEILEHLVAPFNVLRDIPADKILASIPLRLWFASAYRSKTDAWDRHFHEFEDLQWTHPVGKIGFRPLLRRFTPRYYLIYAERPQNAATTSREL